MNLSGRLPGWVVGGGARSFCHSWKLVRPVLLWMLWALVATLVTMKVPRMLLKVLRWPCKCVWPVGKAHPGRLKSWEFKGQCHVYLPETKALWSGIIKGQMMVNNTVKALFQNSRPIVKKRSGTDRIIDISWTFLKQEWTSSRCGRFIGSSSGVRIFATCLVSQDEAPHRDPRKPSQRPKVAHPCWGYLRAMLMCHSKSIIKPSHP